MASFIVPLKLAGYHPRLNRLTKAAQDEHVIRKYIDMLHLKRRPDFRFFC